MTMSFPQDEEDPCWTTDANMPALLNQGRARRLNRGRLNIPLVSARWHMEGFAQTLSVPPPGPRQRSFLP
jgi:hypothetical protein